MFEKSIDQIEGFFPLIWCVVCGGYWYQMFKVDMKRLFEYDIYVTIILFLISIILGYKKITADSRGITKSPYLIPSMKKTKTWSEIKHMAHVSSWSQGQYGDISCSNILCFIDFDDYFFVALGDNFLREKVTNEFQNSNPDAVAATLIHPTSYISKNCFII